MLPLPRRACQKENRTAGINIAKDSLSILQIPITVLKTELEKHARSLRVTLLGRHKYKGLCCGMKSSLASAWMPYFSNVQAVRSNQDCFCSHHNAWSDQSRLISADTTHTHTHLLMLQTNRINVHQQRLHLLDIVMEKV